jgi:hypothetical protein
MITTVNFKKQWSAWAGMVAPLVFASVFLIEGWCRPDYHPFSTYVSALSIGTRGWIQITNFVVFGSLFFIFSRGIAAEFPTGKASKWGPRLLTIIATCYLFSGPFVMDAMGTPRSEMSVHGLVHGILGGIVFSLMPVSCFVFLRRFREDPKWQSLQGWTLGAGVVISAAVIVQTIATKFLFTHDFFKDWLGLIQRAAILPYMIWLFVFAFGLYKRIAKIE